MIYFTVENVTGKIITFGSESSDNKKIKNIEKMAQENGLYFRKSDKPFFCVSKEQDNENIILGRTWNEIQKIQQKTIKSKPDGKNTNG